MSSHDDRLALLSDLFPQAGSGAEAEPEPEPSEGNRVPREGATPTVTYRPTTWGDFLDGFF